MKLENQVCSLELAKRLKELGVKQDSFLWWVNNGQDGCPLHAHVYSQDFMDEHGIHGSKDALCSAWTVAELGVMLPDDIHGSEKNAGSKDSDRLWFCYMDRYDDYGMITPFFKVGKTEADARARVLIRLLEMKLITVEEINKRLAAA